MTVLQELKDYLATEWLQLFDSCSWRSDDRRSRRKGEGKENLANAHDRHSHTSTSMLPGTSLQPAGMIMTGYGQTPGKRHSAAAATPLHGVRGSQSAEFTVCDTIPSSQFKMMVKCPPMIDGNEWQAAHCLSFFHHVNALYGCVSEFCTSDTCPVMTCGPAQTQLPWVDEKGKKWKYAAPQYIDCVMSVLESMICSQEGFPTKSGQTFPASFEQLVRRVCRMLYNVLGHVCYVHDHQLRALNVRPQVYAVLQHFHAYCAEFSLLNDSKELNTLGELCIRWQPVRCAHIAKTASLPPQSHPHHRSAMVLTCSTLNSHGSTSTTNTVGTNCSKLVRRSSAELMDYNQVDAAVPRSYLVGARGLGSASDANRKSGSWGGQSQSSMSVCRMQQPCVT